MSEVKTVTVENGEVQAVIQGLSKLAALSIPTPLALKVRRLMRVMRTETEDIEEIRKGIVDKHCQHDAEGRLVVDDKGMSPFVDAKAGQALKVEIDELMAMRTEAVPVITWAEFGAKLTDEKCADHEEPAGLATILILLGELFEE
jgi:hypothetical protein